MADAHDRSGSSRRNALLAKVEALPTTPGVYQLKSARGAVLYVGKAQSLRARVRQYFAGGDGRHQIPALMDRVADVDVLVTANVKEALLLENELIKRHKPVFNVKLRDDKQYLAVRLDPRERWPRLTSVRRFKSDGAEYFGPYTSSVALKEALSNMRRVFPLRSCSDATFRDYARRGRPCIEYEMKRCLGPCCDLVTPASYAEHVEGTLLFLKGRSSELVEDLRAKMHAAAEQERFEEAARIRDRIQAVESTLEQQQIVGRSDMERDVFGLARAGGEVQVQVLHVREGRVMGAEEHAFSDVALDDGEVVSSFLGQYYAKQEGRDAPRELLSSKPFDDEGALGDLLEERWQRKVVIRTPQRGAMKKLVDIAQKNAELALQQRLEAQESVDAALQELRDDCGLTRLPRRIECYDVSNLQGSLPVASRVVFENGQPVKRDYRRYRIKQAVGGDDYDCLREVMSRRLTRLKSEPLPDLLMVDGGRGQLGVVVAALEDAGLQLDCMGISKERDEAATSPRVKRGGGLKAERLFKAGRANPIQLGPRSKGLLLLQRVRDESHRFAIEYQRDVRSRQGMTSVLEELPGIGPGKRRALLRALGSLKAVRAATRARLEEVSGISARDAETIQAFFAAEQAALERGESADEAQGEDEE